jgi:hypothetical protein
VEEKGRPRKKVFLFFKFLNFIFKIASLFYFKHFDRVSPSSVTKSSCCATCAGMTRSAMVSSDFHMKNLMTRHFSWCDSTILSCQHE